MQAMATSTYTKTWTYEDLFHLPDDGKRYEIVDGELYEMPAPNPEHAAAVVNLILLLAPVVKALGGRIFTAPIDVFMFGADPVQPDIVVLLASQAGLLTRRGVEGAPSLLIEVLSPTNPEHDRIRKRELYARAGIGEYWLVSPEAASIDVLTLTGRTYRTLVRAAGDEPIQTQVLPDLSFPVSTVFAAVIA
jgi:Uma2 family endonuclease